MLLLCKWCDTTKDAEQFVKRVKKEPFSQKNVRCCRDCNREKNKKRYHENPEAWEKQQQANRDWQAKNPKRVKEIQRKYELKNVPKRQAKDAIKHEIRMERMVRGCCEVCATTNNVQGHHDSYEQDRWLHVRWLCPIHHKRWHRVLDLMKAEGESRKFINSTFEAFVEEQNGSKAENSESSLRTIK